MVRSINGLLLGQSIVFIVITLAGFWLFDAEYAGSIAIGSAVAMLPHGIFSVVVFRHRGARNAKAIARSFFLGEGLKLLMTVGLFGLVWITFDRVAASGLIGGYILTVIGVQVGLPVVFMNKLNRMTGTSNGI